MAAGFGTLRLAPAAFWAMTPRELAAALRSHPGVRRASQMPTRSDVEALMRRFPDA